MIRDTGWKEILRKRRSDFTPFPTKKEFFLFLWTYCCLSGVGVGKKGQMSWLKTTAQKTDSLFFTAFFPRASKRTVFEINFFSREITWFSAERKGFRLFLHVFLFFSGGYFFVILSRGERKTQKKKENTLATELMWEGVGSSHSGFYLRSKKGGWDGNLFTTSLLFKGKKPTKWVFCFTWLMGQDFNQGINKPTTRVPMYVHTVPIRATDSGGRGISFSKNKVWGSLFRGRHGSLAFFLGRYFLCHPKKNFFKKKFPSI